MKRIGMVVGGLLMLATTGCVSIGPNYSVDALAQLKPGMAKADVIALLGRPTSTVTLADGRQQLMWVRSRGTMLGTAEARSVILMFDANGRYVGVASQSETQIR